MAKKVAKPRADLEYDRTFTIDSPRFSSADSPSRVLLVEFFWQMF